MYNTLLNIIDTSTHLLSAIGVLNAALVYVFKLYVDSKNQIIKTLTENINKQDLTIEKLKTEHKSEIEKLTEEIKQSKTHEQLVIEKLMIAFDKSNMTLEEVLKLYKNE